MRDSYINRLRAADSIERVIQWLTGRTCTPHDHVLTARCPFHLDDGESLWIHTDGQSYYCDVCRAAGDVIQLVQNFFHIDEAFACELVGVVLGIPKDDVEAPQARQAPRQRHGWVVEALLRHLPPALSAGTSVTAPEQRESSPRLDPADRQGGQPCR